MADKVHVTQKASWGIAPDGSEVTCFEIVSHDLALEVISFGARVSSLVTPDRHGIRASVVLGHAALTPYLEDKAFLGCTVGRFANRIAKGRFALAGTAYQLDINDAPNTLHGGAGGFAHRNWSARIVEDGVVFTITSEDGDQGFPGRVTVSARYRVQGNTITMDYEATTDQTTVVNLTNHAYFNLAGEGSPTVLDHLVAIKADEFLPIDATAIPLGAPAKVEATPFDFTAPQTLGARIEEPDAQLNAAHGYDHNFVLRQPWGTLRPIATVEHPGSGRKLTVSTTEPGVQLYSGNYLDGSVLGRSGQPYGWRSALCLETQHWPDSPSRPEYPSTVLEPGTTLHSTTVWTFDVV